jgi:RNA polymerase sigma factor (sigma-70 family)
MAGVMFGAGRLTDDVVCVAAAGSRFELARLLEALEPQIRLMVAARLSPTPAQLDAVDEITQDVVLALTTGITRLESRTVDGVRAFVSGIATRQVALRLREWKKRDGRLMRSLDSAVSSPSGARPRGQLLPASGTSPTGAVARNEETERLMLELGRLKPRYREAIILAFFDQLPPSEIGDRFGISPQAASMLLIRATRALRRNITGSSRVEQRDASAT